MYIYQKGKYQPMQYCWVHTNQLLRYLVHKCNLPIDIKQVSCSPPDRTAFMLVGYLWATGMYEARCRGKQLSAYAVTAGFIQAGF